MIEPSARSPVDADGAHGIGASEIGIVLTVIGRTFSTMQAQLDRIEAKLDGATNQEWFDLRGAAAYVSMSVESVRSAEKAGKVRSARSKTGRVMFRRRWLDAFASGG